LQAHLRTKQLLLSAVVLALIFIWLLLATNRYILASKKLTWPVQKQSSHYKLGVIL